ncbi:MAG: hypothetical protein IH860_00835 [Chloroflexi bacterium]|nr:hypothetical protein [Chloroflexota bacterium]
MTHPDIRWLAPGELQAAALIDLKTDGNNLSVFEVRDRADEERVATALAATRENPQEYDYAVFSDEELSALGVRSEPSKGRTPDDTVNVMHRILINLTAKQLAEVAKLISRGEYTRILKKQMKSLLVDALASGTLVEERINEKLKIRLQGDRR